MSGSAAAKLKKALERGGATFSKPVAREELEKAAKRLGVAFPPSYAELVTTYGAFTLSGELTGRGRGNDTSLFPPARAAKETLAYRAKMAKARDEDAKEILNDGILFCGDPKDEAFHLFVVSTRTSRGEMKTRHYDYQDPGNNDPWFEGDGTFASVVTGLLQRVRKRKD